jgi:hypothetical protein
MQHQVEKSQPSTTYENRTGILHYCASQFGQAITRGWVDSFQIRHQNGLIETVNKSQEDARL